ncbi:MULTISPECIES: IS607 family transposase [Moorena]|uniref:Putative site-specific integrase-resolvase n=1 Tax=Moorena producens 3L TaxID=489825 RepID=F4XWY2_9CYAN|nr:MULTISPECIES: IS607 family transposase [Moorena]NEQ13953.1 IS607 family transposase [Moorena sp. SIO3E2]EGJ30867.1 putative site-specific integrase-resolvase [Moorena producens 3L]NEP36041.1 IS607 family transposase [Moorena sp. SIO3B2]NEP64831.1 IS607 family transposase [Moorena sp. SIO3A5]NEQ05320.1 IS607 family transposase [Moorena sp. SIO4E2]
MALIPIRKAVELTGLSRNTLRKYADNGIIKCERTPSGYRLFDTTSLLSLGKSKGNREATICYCRVSSNKQKDDLARQIAYMHSLFPEAEIVKDIGSGLNYKRKGLRIILERLMQGDQLTIIVACPCRLTRFGFELFEYLVSINGGKILVLDNHESCPESELTADLLSIIHVFSCRVHGLRKYGKKIKEDASLPKP